MSDVNAKAEGGRPYEYYYSSLKRFDDKKPTTLHRQGIANTPANGGSWIRRGDLTPSVAMPRAISRLEPDAIISRVETNRSLASQVQEIDGLTPAQKAHSLIDLAAKYPVRGGQLILESFEGWERCQDARGNQIDNFFGGSLRESLEPTFAAPTPNVSLAR